MFDMHLPKAPGCADSSSRRKHVAKVVSSNVDGSFSLGGWTKRLHEGQDLEEDEHGQSAQCLSLTSIADPTWPPTGVPLWPPLPNCAHLLAHQEQEYGCRVRYCWKKGGEGVSPGVIFPRAVLDALCHCQSIRPHLGLTCTPQVSLSYPL